jgi:Na+/melibiose symporter-like transporter
MVAGLTWFGLGIFSLIQNPAYSFNWILGWVFLMLCMMCLFAMFWFREKKEDSEVDEDEERHEKLKKQVDDIRKRRNSW